jgi:hypothetical protein
VTNRAVHCSVCNHLQIVAIDAAIEDGRLSLRALARMYGLSPSSLKRHKDGGHVTPKAPSSTPPSTSLGVDASGLEHLRKIVRDLSQRDVSTLSERARSQHTADYLRAVQALARAEPPPHVADSHELENKRLRAEHEAIAKAFIKDPVAMAVIAAALKPLRGIDWASYEPEPIIGPSTEEEVTDGER